MRDHPPKIRALLAYDAGMLSSEGEARIERHLAKCEICQRAYAEITALEQVAEEVRESSVDVNYSAIELELRREAKSVAAELRVQRHRRRIGLALALAAAAAMALTFLPRHPGPRGEVANGPPVPVPAPPPTPQPEALPEPMQAEAKLGTLVALAGAVRIDGEAAALGDEIAEGALIESGEGVAHVDLGAGTSFAALPQTRLRAPELRADRIALELLEGRVSSQVRTGTAYDVLAPPYRVRVQGTRFEVRRNDDDVSVTLDEGIVEVVLGDTLVRRMEAPDRWSSRDGFDMTELGQVLTPHRLSEGESSATLSLMGDERVVSWRVRGLDLRGQNAAISLSPCDVVVEALDARGRVRRRTFTLLPEGGELTSTELRRPQARRARLDPADIAAVVNPAKRRLRVCYERELRRNNPDFSGAYSLRVSVGADGSVRTVRVTTEDDLPPSLRSCLVRMASQWTFPAPGGTVSFDLPLNFRAR
ncbi:MAG: AgmX/PglI C-terminal domain-containing protein [Myxococcota bacterium]